MGEVSKTRKRLIAVLVMALTISALVVGPAGADPDNRNSIGPIAVDCGPAGRLSVVAHGNGRFAAAQVIGSTDVLVPLAFKDASFTYTDPDGMA